MKKIIFPFFLFFLLLSITAQVPQGYYQSAEGKSNANLKTALHQIIKVGTRLGYGSGSGKTWSGFEKTDLHPNGYVWDMYSTNKVKFPGGGGVPSGMNIEHSVAKSWWGGTNNNAYKDLYHLNPSNTNANSARSNYPLGITDGKKFDNGSIKVGNNSYGTEYNGLCFEPLDEYKGDFARAYLYMFTCYEDFKWTGTCAPTMLKSPETWPMLLNWAKNLLVEWHRNDPVSEKELKRTSEIFKIQNNRNPYVDYPELVEYLWGTQVGQPWTAQGGDVTYISSPGYGENIDFGTVAFGKSSTYTLHIKGENLKSALSLTLSGSNAADMSLSVSTLDIETAEAGVDIIVSYSANSVGEKNAVLSISGEDLTTVNVTIKALASDDFMALPATGINQSAFVANWTSSATADNYSLNVFTMESAGVTEPKLLVETDFTTGLPSGWKSEGYSDSQTAGSIRLASGSNPGKIISPALDLSGNGIVLTVKARQYSNDAGAVITVSLDNDELVQWTTETSNKDFIIELPNASDASNISLSAEKNRRVYVDYFKVETPAEVQSAVSVSGFPLETGKVLSYPVNGLLENTEYYYTVTTVGSKPLISSKMSVQTLALSGLGKNQESPIRWVSNATGVSLYNLNGNYHFTVLDITGKHIVSTYSSDSQKEIQLPARGLYILKITNGQNTKNIKIMY